jgi:hypothetical protein
MPPENLQEIYRLVKENNRMLHKMRRTAFWGGIIKFILYAVLLLAPLWLYYSYLSPIVDSALGTMQELQGTGARAGAQFGNIEQFLKQLQGGGN